MVADWIASSGQDVKVFAVSGGDPTQNWAQGRMQGFIDGITELVPDARFVNDAASGLNTSYDPAGTYDAYKAFLVGNPDVQFIENVDIGAEHADRAIQDLGLDGKVHTIGWNVSKGQLDAVEQGTQVAALGPHNGILDSISELARADFEALSGG
jgi:ribose transport system substrate-binding protein